MTDAAVAPPRFWERLREFGSKPAIVDALTNVTITYRQLADLVQQGADRHSEQPKMLVGLSVDNDVGGIVCYLALLLSRHAVILCGSQGQQGIDAEVVRLYRPDLVVWKDGSHATSVDDTSYQRMEPWFGHSCAKRVHCIDYVCPDIAVLMSTSGSSGRAKMVRLSYSNVAVNAWQIAEALTISPNERVVLSLPMHHSYGLSVLHGALYAGACVVLGKRTLLDRGFWDIVRSHRVTTVPAVPVMLEFLQGIRMDGMTLPSLEKVTVSGASMSTRTRDWALSRLLDKGIKFYSMYGMTEATARMAVLPPDSFAAHPTSVGRAVPQGRLEILASGEIVYHGPNVMMGYAIDRTGVVRGDDLRGSINTGDLGTLDSAGNLYITGRLSRLCKILGWRISLSDVEEELEKLSDIEGIAAASDDRVIWVFYTSDDASRVNAAADHLARRMRIPRAAFVLRQVGAIPRSSSGKVLYKELTKGLPGET